jgi:hypothetical protein
MPCIEPKPSFLPSFLFYKFVSFVIQFFVGLTRKRGKEKREREKKGQR